MKPPILQPLKSLLEQARSAVRVDVVDRLAVAEVEMTWLEPGALVTGVCLPPGFSPDDVLG